MTKFDQGVSEGINGLFDKENNDPAYLAGVRKGLLTYAKFLASTEDHVRPRQRNGRMETIPYDETGRHNGSHIRFALPDLSDQEGTTGHEDRHSLH